MKELTRTEILANRQKWIDFLKIKGRRKALGLLDAGGGRRCCLGHGCFVLGIKRAKVFDLFVYEDCDTIPPDSLKELVGLWDNVGGNINGDFYSYSSQPTLAGLNDVDRWKPVEIANYLETVIEGGPSTPFIPLKNYL